MRVLVTGATGFVGFHAVQALVDAGHSVRVLVRDLEKAHRVLGGLALESGDVAHGDMADASAVRKAIDGCDAVLHSAASVAITTGGKDLDTNLVGTQTVIGEAVARDLPALHVSSLQVLMTPGEPVTDRTLPQDGKTPYSRSKAAADRWVREQLARGGQISIVYPPGVVGPDDPGLSESVKACRSFLRGTLTFGALQQVDARDLGRLLVRVLEAGSTGPIVVGGHYFTFDTLTEAIERVTGARVPRIRTPAPVLRVVAALSDVLSRFTGRDTSLSGEGIDILRGWRQVHDSDLVAELGVAWRPAEETLADMYRWLVEAGRLPASAVPAIQAGSSIRGGPDPC